MRVKICVYVLWFSESSTPLIWRWEFVMRHTDFFACQKGMRRGLVCECAQQPLTEKYPRHCLCSSWKISSRPIRNNKKLVHLFKSPPPFWLCSEFDPLLHCIFYWCHPCGGCLAACEGVRKSDVRSTAARVQTKISLSTRERAACASRCDASRDIFPRGARECSSASSTPSRARLLLPAQPFPPSIERDETHVLCYLFNQSGTAQITSCCAAAFNDRQPSPI